MAVTPEALLFPAGRLNAAILWPGKSADTVNEYLSAFITDGEAKVEDWDADAQDAGTTAWATYRALDAVLFELKMMPGSVTFADEGSAAFTAEQLRMLEADRVAALAEFTALEETALADDPYDFTTLRSLRD